MMNNFQQFEHSILICNLKLYSSDSAPVFTICEGVTTKAEWENISQVEMQFLYPNTVHTTTEIDVHTYMYNSPTFIPHTTMYVHTPMKDTLHTLERAITYT